MVKQLDLPSIYKEREKNPVPERYKKYIVLFAFFKK